LTRLVRMADNGRPLRRLAILVGLAAVYVIAGKLGLRLAITNPSATAVWAPTGIALAGCLIFGRWVWPAVFVGALVVNVTTAGGWLVGLGIATGNTLEAWIGAWLLERYGRGLHTFEQAREIFRYTLLVAFGSTIVSATFGVTSLALGGAASWSSYGTVWLTWWLGDAGGALVVAPLLLLWRPPLSLRLSSRRALEASILLAGTGLLSEIVFGVLPMPGRGNYPIEFLCTPLFIWAAFRFGQRTSAVVVALVYGVAVYGTVHGYGPFAQPSRNEALLLLQGFVCVVSVTTLTLAAVVSERRRVEERLRQMAVSDPLTGLANYRHLIDVLEREIQRSQRTERPFALLFLDLDRLKAINDRHGHLVGSRALWRVAEVLRRTSRAIDTAARYGGDEFALVLPESDAEDATQVAERVRALLAEDPEQPPVTVSAGVAVFPRDGEDVTSLLALADHLQYQDKRRVTSGARR
jgi:diguanylate cyclase (GGDEF)-like protein